MIVMIDTRTGSAPDLAMTDAQAAALLASLNPEQQGAVRHGREPLLIIAGAGTGKTTTLAHRVAWLIAGGVKPQRMLLLTFTRRAAGEMLRRVEAILLATSRTTGSPAACADGSRPSALRRAALRDAVWGGTFHATAARLLRLHGREIGLDPGFTILDRTDAEDLLNVLRTELGLAKSDRRFPQKSTCMDIYSRCVNAQQRLELVLRTSFPWCVDEADDLKQLFAAYVRRKADHAVLDYDDLLLFWHGLLTDPGAASRVRSRFDRVLVDEYQDTNALQAGILAGLSPDGRGLTVVGDDAQSIYSFRAATVRNILDFPVQFPGATVLTLTQNYRSHQPLLSATNTVIAQATERYEKHLWSQRAEGRPPALVTCTDEQEQTEYVVERILEHREAGLQLRQQAVLFRASHHSLDLELELSRRNIPYHKYGGLKFLEAAHVKDLLAFLRFAENGRDVTAGLRMLQLLPGIGPKRARELLDHVPRAGGNAAGAWAEADVPPALSQTWPRLVEMLRTLTAAEPPPVPAQLHLVRTFYGPLLERMHDNPVARMQDLEQLEQLATRYADRGTFLAELTLDPPSWTGDLAGPPVLDEDYLILSTMHSAKGLEWDAVYVIHAADGNIPSDMSTGSDDEIEEERRLFYVALTRAKDWLYVTVPLQYYRRPRDPFDRYGYAQPTRFVSDDVKPFFVHASAGPPPSVAEGASVTWGNGGAAPTTAERIRAGVLSLWD